MDHGRESEAKFRALFDNAGDAIFIMQDDRFIDCNVSTLGLFGCLTRDQIVGHAPYEFSPPLQPNGRASREFAIEKITAAYAGRHQFFEWTHTKLDGTPFPAEVSLSRLELGGKVSLLAIVRDITKRTLADEALRQSEAKYRELVDNANSIILRMNAVGEVIFFNRFAELFFGYSEAEVLGKNVVGTIVPETESTGRDLRAMIEDIGRRPDNYSVNENENMRRNGECVWIAWTNKGILDGQGRVKEVLCVGNDISGRKQAEEALRDSDEALRSVVGGNPIPQFVIDRDHRVIQWNKALEALIGLTASGILGTTQHWKAFYDTERPCLSDLLLDGATDETLARWYPGKSLKPSAATGAYEATDFFPRRGAAGVWLQFTAAVIRNAEGRVIGAVETLEDITERRQAEEALRESEQRHRTILRTAMDGFWRADLHGRLLEVNETYCRMSGYSPPELLAMHIPDLDAAETADDVAAHIKKTMAQGEDRFESRHRRKDGSVFDVEVSVQYRPNEGGGCVAFLRDITARKRAQEEVQQAYCRLKETQAQLLQAGKLAAVGQLAAGLAHELKNPLANISSSTELLAAALLKESSVSAERQVGVRKHLANIERGAYRCKGIIDNVLGFGTKGRQAVEKADLALLLADAVSLARKDPRYRRQVILCHVLPAESIGGIHGIDAALKERPVPASLPPLPMWTRPSQIQQVILNLLLNAMDATTAEGWIVVAAGRRTGATEIVVADDGKGIPAEDQGHVFEPFFTTKPVGKGTGLGLYLCHQILAGLGGTITLHSRVGEGTLARVCLPDARRS